MNSNQDYYLLKPGNWTKSVYVIGIIFNSVCYKIAEALGPVFYLSNKGKRKASFKGNSYSRDKEYNENTYWKCSKGSVTNKRNILYNEVVLLSKLAFDKF